MLSLYKINKMKLYQLRSSQLLPISAHTAWEFLSSPANLKVITPERMDFTILSGGDRAMFPGQIIQYKVAPFPGYSTKWVTEITHVSEGNYFVDEQRFGPYVLWHHKHFLQPVEGGVLMEDVIDYKLPFGVFGRLAHKLFIKNQLKQIFHYREKQLTALFGASEKTKNTLQFTSI
tara:strand:- start:337 stop:861 length:525 start_codon:yes stop_codon:yes gene_type:complete